MNIKLRTSTAELKRTLHLTVKIRVQSHTVSQAFPPLFAYRFFARVNRKKSVSAHPNVDFTVTGPHRFIRGMSAYFFLLDLPQSPIDQSINSFRSGKITMFGIDAAWCVLIFHAGE